MKEFKVRVLEVLDEKTIRIDKKIRGTDIIRIANIDELLEDLKEAKE